MAGRTRKNLDPPQKCAYCKKEMVRHYAIDGKKTIFVGWYCANFSCRRQKREI